MENAVSLVAVKRDAFGKNKNFSFFIDIPNKERKLIIVYKKIVNKPKFNRFILLSFLIEKIFKDE